MNPGLQARPRLWDGTAGGPFINGSPLRGNVLETDNLMEKLLWVDGFHLDWIKVGRVKVGW